MPAAAARLRLGRHRLSTRHAACSCEQLRLTVEREPIRVSICHYLACRRRTGSVFGVRARFFDPGGTRLMTTSSNGRIRLWDISSGEPIACP